MAHEATQEGTIFESLPNQQYRVEMAGGKELICYVAGKMVKNKIRLLIGDRVNVVVDPYGGKATNRIVRRLNK